MSSLVNSIKYLGKKAEEILSNSSYKVSISLFLKSDKYYRKKNLQSNSFQEQKFKQS